MTQHRDVPRLVLVRHGSTAWSETGQHTGRTDMPLTALGEQQAAALAPRLAEFRFARVLSSPLRRAVRTAELAGFAGRVETTDLLLEMDYGDDEGRTRDAIRAERPGWDLFLDGPLHGETLAQVAARAAALFHQLEGAAGPLLLVAHGHVLRVLTAVYLGLEPIFGRHLELGPASISVLGTEHEFRTIERWNGA
jgi:broad specificity phosphatase PhoE